MKKLSKQIEDLQAENRKASINVKIDKLIAEGKVLPSQRADLFTILIGGNAEKKYSVGKETFDSMEEAMFAFIGAGPKIAPATEESTEVGRKESKDLDAKAKDYAEKNKVSYKEALQSISRETGQAA